ncbi:probable serine hydrolase isoform X2 [Macrosteles quadrilineatus]|nr:probable serine hydrolase isoform X2 [Macrosteles quadrilineatus]
MTEGEPRRFHEIEIPVPWGHVSGKWWGPRNKDPIIAIHGWQDNAGTFDNLAPLLPVELALLCIDLPGHGFSSHYPQGQYYYIWWDSLVLLRRVVLHLGLKRVSLLGHSLGGAVGFLYAATYPETVDKLVSIDIVCPRVERPEILVDQTKICIDRYLKYESMAGESVPCYDRKTMLNIVEDAYQGSVSRDNCEVLMRRGMKPSPTDEDKYYFSRDARLKIAGLAQFSKDLVKAYASKITCEYLNIRAEPGISFAYPELYDELLDTIKEKSAKFEYHKVKGSHHIHLEDASAVADIIGKFFMSEPVEDLSNNLNDLVV